MSGNNINGVINVYKEKGYTSHDVVAKLRGILNMKKIGHTGTLDPDAEGVLPVCIGNATKLCDLIMEKDKEYAAELILGKQTDTQDISGRVLNESDNYQNISKDKIEKTILGFTGEYDQIPPMYSAVKVNGKKLYELARNGIEIERKPRKVHIHRIEIESANLPVIRIKVNCSKGTYIRTLCNDIGMKLGTYGCMGALLRTKTGRFALEDSLRLGQIEEIVRSGRLTESGILMKVDVILAQYPKLSVKDKFEKLLENGNVLTWNMFQNAECEKEDGMMYRVYDSADKFEAVYQYKESEDIFRLEKMFKC